MNVQRPMRGGEETEDGGQKTREWIKGGNLTQWEMFFDERVSFLGCLVEMGIYRVSGILINDYRWMIIIWKS